MSILSSFRHVDPYSVQCYCNHMLYSALLSPWLGWQNLQLQHLTSWTLKIPKHFNTSTLFLSCFRFMTLRSNKSTPTFLPQVYPMTYMFVTYFMSQYNWHILCTGSKQRYLPWTKWPPQCFHTGCWCRNQTHHLVRCLSPYFTILLELTVSVGSLVGSFTGPA